MKNICEFEVPALSKMVLKTVYIIFRETQKCSATTNYIPPSTLKMSTSKSCNFGWSETANGQWEIKRSGWWFHFQDIKPELFGLGICGLGLCWSYGISHWKLFWVLNDWDDFFLKDKHDWDWLTVGVFSARGTAFPFYKPVVMGCLENIQSWHPCS